MVERKREFSVPLGLMIEFADAVSNWGLSCDITGTARDKEIIVQVNFDPLEQGKGISELRKLLENYCED